MQWLQTSAHPEKKFTSMNSRLASIVLIFFLCIVFAKSHAQTDTVFWFAAPDLQQLHGDRPIFLRISTSKQLANVTISIPANPTFAPINISVNPNSSGAVDLTNFITQIENGTPNTVMQKGILVTSTAPISCYYDILHNANGDMYALKGRNGLGTKFTLPFQMKFTNRTGASYTTDFIVVATEDNTTVEVIPKNNLVGHVAGVSFTVVLNKGETWVGTSMSTFGTMKPGGTVVKSNKPIAISTKDDSINDLTCSDTVGDQLIPDRLAGTEFVLVKGYLTNPDYFVVFAIDDNTLLKVDGLSVAPLSAGAYYSGSLSTEAVYIESNKPVHVFHVTGFGCEMGGAVIPSIKCTGSNEVAFTRASMEGNFYISILSPKSIVDKFLLNGSPSLVGATNFLPVNVTAGEWMYLRIPIHTSSLSLVDEFKIQNSAGKFHAGVIQGGRSSTARFGYFSDFSVNSISFDDPSNPGSSIGSEQVVCNNADFKITANNKDALEYIWTGPAGLTVVGPTLEISGFKSGNTGVYTVTTSGNACGNASKSINLLIDKPEADFNVVSNGCQDDGVAITTSANAGVRWQWNFGGKLLDTNRSVLNPVVLGKSGAVDISLKVGSARGCFSDVKNKTIQLSSKPLARYEVLGNSCINDDIVFKEKSSILNGNITKWRWNLDDGNGFSEQTISAALQKKYTTWGKRDVRLVVESSTGCISDTFRLSTFTVHPLPVPGFVVPEICLDDAVALFRDTTSSPDGYGNFEYQWSFNSGPNPVSPGPIFSDQERTAKNPSVTYRAADKYAIKLVVTSRGCVDSITQSFKVNGANPVAAFDVLTPLTLCSNDSVRIENRSTVGIDNVTRLEIYWNDGDTRTASITTIDETPFLGKSYAIKYPNFQSPLKKDHTVTLTAYSGNAQACRKSISKVVTLNASPKVGFASMSGICLDATARQITETTFDASVPGTGSYHGAGVSLSGLFDPKSAGAGTHTITYRYLSQAQAGCADSAFQTITVWPLPTATFSVGSITCEKNPIIFTSNSKAGAGILTKWIWSFGDGVTQMQTATPTTTTHTYSSYATYSPTLIVETSNGCKSAASTIGIQVYPLPIPGFSLPEVCLPLAKAVFTGTTTVPDNSILSYRWDFGDPLDKSASVTKDGQHDYKALGSYNVKLVVTSINNCRDSLTKVFSGIFPQPKAGFSSADSSCLGTAIQFSDTGKTSRGEFVEWYWDLGDKSKEEKNKFSYTYSSSGTYVVSLFAKTSIGCLSDTISKAIMVFDYPKADAGPDLFVLDDGQKQIKASASGASLKYRWSPSTYLSDTSILNPYIIRPQDSVIYILSVTGRGSCTTTDDLKMIALKLPTPPNTFTPNGDGVNDKWEILYLDQYEGCIVEVYSTTGQMLFQSIGYGIPWDGTYKGSRLPSGTYYYVIDPKNGRKKIASYVTLLR